MKPVGRVDRAPQVLAILRLLVEEKQMRQTASPDAGSSKLLSRSQPNVWLRWCGLLALMLLTTCGNPVSRLKAPFGMAISFSQEDLYLFTDTRLFRISLSTGASDELTAQEPISATA